MERLKIVTEDLLDLWLHEGSKGLAYVQASRAYQLTDPYVNYVGKFEAVKTKAASSVAEFKQKIVVFHSKTEYGIKFDASSKHLLPKILLKMHILTD